MSERERERGGKREERERAIERQGELETEAKTENSVLPSPNYEDGFHQHKHH